MSISVTTQTQRLQIKMHLVAFMHVKTCRQLTAGKRTPTGRWWDGRILDKGQKRQTEKRTGHLQS